MTKQYVWESRMAGANVGGFFYAQDDSEALNKAKNILHISLMYTAAWPDDRVILGNKKQNGNHVKRRF